MKLTKSGIKGLDLFAIPFQFTLGKSEKGKKTFNGGILSILIGVASLSYFIYLCYLYWTNKIAPSTSII